MIGLTKLKGFACGLLTVLIWGVTFVNTRVLLEDFNSYEILVLRFAMAYAALWAFAPRRIRSEGWREEAAYAGMGLAGVAVYQYLENCAIDFTNASNVSILVSTCPMGTAILSAWCLHEKTLTRRFVLGFCLAMAGVAMVCIGGVSGLSFSPFGDLIALCAMLSWSVYSVMITRMNAKGVSPLVVTRRVFFWAVVFMLPFLPFSFDFSPAVNAARFAKVANVFHLGFLGLLASALAFVMWNFTCKALGTVRATCGLYFIPVVTAIVAYLALGESFTLTTGLGAVLTLIGVMVCG